MSKFLNVDWDERAQLVGQYIMIIRDARFWMDNEEAIRDWYRAADITFDLQGMVLRFDSEEDRLAFRLAWESQ